MNKHVFSFKRSLFAVRFPVAVRSAPSTVPRPRSDFRSISYRTILSEKEHSRSEAVRLSRVTATVHAQTADSRNTNRASARSEHRARRRDGTPRPRPVPGADGDGRLSTDDPPLAHSLHPFIRDTHIDRRCMPQQTRDTSTFQSSTSCALCIHAKIAARAQRLAVRLAHRYRLLHTAPIRKTTSGRIPSVPHATAHDHRSNRMAQSQEWPWEWLPPPRNAADPPPL